ncbi:MULTISPECIES: putative glycolipid-binding domain-containing protein [unclassified Streptomyces]|uniref:putative glycolipid-binding domain-containing protein n=1 Tax=unclassified Streptomyces TaxID=2593676 RepID=UPI002250C044|nr:MULTISPECIES: putative glycolipid-binding domain-containing protein [unclassified Streptomyces]MCX4529582.1 putative glycolipid-binding domain-containing protein [Streptomyces sp. NBC_01551]MCX4539845.1 putative glycolipid-binding domain-containing protein [Streptomyces sp. NBC_01565]
MISQRLVRTWDVHPSEGYSTAWAEVTGRRLAARGRAVGVVPEPYWLAYTLETGDDYVTSRLRVSVETGSAARGLDLRNDAGRWSVDGTYRPDLDGALDCDLGLCPLTNTMPVLRHGLHRRPDAGPHDFLMAWVSVPDLTVSANRQTYTPLAGTGDAARIRYASGDFRSDVEFDGQGLVLDYPELATALTR